MWRVGWSLLAFRTLGHLDILWRPTFRAPTPSGSVQCFSDGVIHILGHDKSYSGLIFDPNGSKVSSHKKVRLVTTVEQNFLVVFTARDLPRLNQGLLGAPLNRT